MGYHTNELHDDAEKYKTKLKMNLSISFGVFTFITSTRPKLYRKIIN